MTKLEVLARLRQANGAFVSGEQLCAELSLSRNSIWKAVNRLRKEGYPIEAVTHRGYRLATPCERPDFLDEAAIQEALTTRVLGRKLQLHLSVSSTNAVARTYADDPENEGLCILAELQTAGKGKNGRQFLSAEGGVYLSVILQPNRSSLSLPLMREAAMHAIVQAVQAVCQLAVEYVPINELFVGGKKLGGLLSEVRIESESDRISSMVLGIGIYCNNQPFADDDPRTCIMQCTGKQVDRNALVAAILNEMERALLD